MNGAGVALVGNAGAVFSNPASIATLRHVGVEGAYRSGPADGHLSVGAVGWRLRQFDVGLGVGYMRFGENVGPALVPSMPIGSEAHEVAGVGSLVYRFGIIALGASGKYAQRVIGDVRDDAMSMDAGIAIAIFDIMAIGFSKQNIGGVWGRDGSVHMPSLTRLGITWNYVDPLETFRLLSTAEFQWREGGEYRTVLGGEGGIVIGGVGLFARAGYSSGNPPTRWTFGGTVALSRLALDYAYRRADVVDEPSHRFGFRLTL